MRSRRATWDAGQAGPTAAVFPGAGIALTGHEQALLAAHDAEMRPPIEAASRFAGRDLAPALPARDLDGLAAREAQLLTYAYSLAVLEVLRRDGFAPALLAGHSLGVYAALVAAGCLSFDEGLVAVDAACRIATEACAGRDCGMVTATGLGPDEVAELLSVRADAAAGATTLRAVITNNAISVVVAGAGLELETYLADAVERNATRAVWLDRRVAYHHPGYLSGASLALDEVASRLAWREPETPIVSSLDGAVLTTALAARDFMVRNLSSPIRWPRVLDTLARHGCGLVCECGPGTTLTRIGRFDEAAPPYVSVQTLARGR